MNLLALYVDRTRFELRTLLRDRRTVMFSVILPIFMLVIFGSVFHMTIPNTHVKFAQYFVAGLLASGLLYSAFQQLAIAIPEERFDGTLKRLIGSPMPKSVYFVGKLGVSTFIYIFQAIALLGLGHFLFDIHLPHSAASWLTFAWVSALGLISSSLLGIALSNYARDGRAASAIAAPLVLYFQFTSGVYFVYTSLPMWMRSVSALFPLKWMAQAIRGVFLPSSFGRAEVAHSFEYARTAVVLGAWSVIALAICVRTFRWLPKGEI